MEGLVEGSVRDVWVPLEKVSSGELRLQIEAVRVEDHEGPKVCYHFTNFLNATCLVHSDRVVAWYVICSFSTHLIVQGSTIGLENGWIELVLIEARDLIAADLRGTSDPYVRVQYGNLKKRTKV